MVFVHQPPDSGSPGQQSFPVESPARVLPPGFDAIVVSQALTGFRYDKLPAGPWPPYCLEQHHLLWVLTSPPAGGQCEIENYLNHRHYPAQVYGEADSILVPAGVTHQVTLQSPPGATLWLFDQALFRQLVNRQSRPDGLRELVPQAKTHDSSLYHLTMALHAEVISRPANRPTTWIYPDLLVSALADRLIQHHSACQLKLSARLRAADLALLLAYIDSHLEQALNSQHLADLINLEVTELEWSFEKMMGLSLQSYIHEQRQQRLQRLLKTMSLGQPLVLPSNHLRPNANAITVGFYPSNPTNPPQHPSIQAAIAWLNQRLLVVTGKPLTDTQVRILTGVLQGQRYGQMAQQYNQSEGHLKGVAADLWKQLSLICGEPIRKPNLWAYLQRQGLLTDAKPALSTDRQPL